MKNIFYALIFSIFIPSIHVYAIEYPIGQAQIKNGMEVAAVYLQPIEMEPAGMMGDPKQTDIHLEADIQATAENINGFAEGDWIPYLIIQYQLERVDTGQTIQGEMMSMVASDGPHYGDNVKLFGPGKYRLTLTVIPPSKNQHAHFGRHIDKETGVAPWFDTFSLQYDFLFVGIGKKGAY